MAEKEVSFLTDRSIGGRFKRALAVALPSIALARKDPYLVKALYDKEEEFGKLDRQDASDLIKTTASSITDLITKNKATRKNRVNSNLESLTALKGKFPELENADIALIQKRGLGGTLEKIKTKFNLDNLNGIVTMLKENTDLTAETPTSKVPNMTLNELAEALAIPAKNIDLQMKQIRSQPSSGPITSFVTGEMFDDEKGVDLTPRIQNIVKSADVSQAVDTAKEKELQAYFDTKKDIFTEAGKVAKRITSLGAKEDIGEEKMAKVAEAAVAKRLGLSVSISTQGDVIYAQDAKKYEKVVPRIAQIIKQKALSLKIEGPKLDDPRFYTNQSAIDQVINENFKVEGDVAEGKGKDRPQGFILKSLQDVGLEKISENTGPVKKNKKDTTVEPLRGRQINKMYKDEVKNIKDAYDKLLIEINKEKRQSVKQSRRNAAKQKYLQDLSDAKSKYRQMFLDNNLKPSDYGL
jgi:hypothetical protein